MIADLIKCALGASYLIHVHAYVIKQSDELLFDLY